MVAPGSAYFISCCSRPSASARSGISSSTPSSGSPLSFFSRSGAVLMVCFLMSSCLFTSRHASGIDTGAPGQRPHAERRHQQLAGAVLEVIDVHPAVPPRHLPRDGGDLGKQADEAPREQLAE